MYCQQRLPRPAPAACVFIAMVCAALLAMSLMSGCNTGQRRDTIRASLITVQAAQDGFIAWDRAHQLALVDHATSRDEAERTVSAYHAKRQHVIDGFEVAYRAIAVAATQTDDLSLQAALTSAAKLVDAVQTLIGGK